MLSLSLENVAGTTEAAWLFTLERWCVLLSKSACGACVIWDGYLKMKTWLPWKPDLGYCCKVVALIEFPNEWQKLFNEKFRVDNSTKLIRNASEAWYFDIRNNNRSVTIVPVLKIFFHSFETFNWWILSIWSMICALGSLVKRDTLSPVDHFCHKIIPILSSLLQKFQMYANFC